MKCEKRNEQGVPEELLNRAKQGDREALEELVSRNLGLVHSMVSRFESSLHDKEDLFQVGCMGLVKAIRRFDPELKYQFSTYACTVIIGEIRRYLRDHGAVKVPRGARDMAVRALRELERLRRENGVEPSVSEVAQAVGCDAADLAQALEGLRHPASLDQPDDSGGSKKTTLADRVEDCRDDWEENVQLKTAVSMLDPPDRKILIWRYFYDLTQTEVARLLGISQAQVSRKEALALEKIRNLLT